MTDHAKQVTCGTCKHFEMFGWQGLDGGFCHEGVKPIGDICQWADRQHTCGQFRRKSTTDNQKEVNLC